jgi:hypothetical protein
MSTYIQFGVWPPIRRMTNESNDRTPAYTHWLHCERVLVPGIVTGYCRQENSHLPPPINSNIQYNNIFGFQNNTTILTP